MNLYPVLSCHIRRRIGNLRRLCVLLLTNNHSPGSSHPSFFHNLQHNIREYSVRYRTYPERHEIYFRLHIQIIQVQNLITVRDRTLAVDLLPVFAREAQITESVDSHIADGPLDRRQMIECL